jgi:hypothetical protein
MSDDACDVKPGRAYLCGVCLTCQEPIPLLQVHPRASRGNVEALVFKGVPCPSCRTRHNYPLREAICLEAEPSGRRRGADPRVRAAFRRRR